MESTDFAPAPAPAQGDSGGTQRVGGAAPAVPDLALPAETGAGTLWQATQLVLWLLAGTAGLTDAALAGLGLDRSALDSLRRLHHDELEGLRLLQAASRLLPRSATAELLRCRVNSMALSARTPAELAAVARTVKTLPDWVWEDALVLDAGAGSNPSAKQHSGSGSGDPASGSYRAAQPVGNAERLQDWQTAVPSTVLVDSLPLNRQQRRALESSLRKSR